MYLVSPVLMQCFLLTYIGCWISDLLVLLLLWCSVSYHPSVTSWLHSPVALSVAALIIAPDCPSWDAVLVPTTFLMPVLVTTTKRYCWLTLLQSTVDSHPQNAPGFPFFDAVLTSILREMHLPWFSGPTPSLCIYLVWYVVYILLCGLLAWRISSSTSSVMRCDVKLCHFLVCVNCFLSNWSICVVPTMCWLW